MSMDATSFNCMSMSSNQCGRVDGAYLLSLHVQHCVVGHYGLLGLCFLDMVTLHYSLINLVNCVYVGHFLLRVLSGDGGCKYKSFGALAIRVVHIGLG